MCIISICFLFLIGGCNNNLSDIVKENMSDLRINYFVGENDNMQVNLSCGYREDPFDYNGVSETKVECGVLTVSLTSGVSYNQIAVELNVDGEIQEVVLDKSPYDETYAADLEKIFTEKNNIKLKLKNGEKEIELKEISNNWKYNYKNALNIGVSHFAGTIDQYYYNGKLNAEGYLKVLYKKDFNKTFWYFGLITTSGERFGVLIEVNEGIVEL